MLQFRRIGVVASFSAAVLLWAFHGPDSPPRNSPQPAGPARLVGRVIAADNGAPVRRAYVRLSGLPESQRRAGGERVYITRELETARDGRFAFEDLPAGWYAVTIAVESGFVPLLRARETTVRAGETANFTIRLPRTGVLVGRVEDEHGEAVVGARVQALRNGIGFGGRRLANSVGRLTETDDRGQFRIFNLPAGEYYVVATYTRPQFRAEHGPHKLEDAPRSGYALTYHPSVRKVPEARPVLVRAGRESHGVVIRLLPCRFARLRIKGIDSRGVPLGSRGSATLTLIGDAYLPHASWHAGSEAGSFVFPTVAPGVYSLVVATSVQREEAAYTTVTVDGEDRSLNVQTNAGARLSGRAVLDEKSRRTSGTLRRIGVSALPPQGSYGVSYAAVPPTEVARDGAFTLKGLRGPMVLYADTAGGALVSITRAGEDITGKTIEFTGTEVIDDVEIVVTTEVATLEVSVMGSSRSDEPEPVLVLLFAEDRNKWHSGHLAHGSTTAWPKGFTGATLEPLRLIRMVPGQYRVIAIPDPNLSYPTDVRLLEALHPRAIPVTLVAGQAAQATLRVVPFRP